MISGVGRGFYPLFLFDYATVRIMHSKSVATKFTVVFSLNYQSKANNTKKNKTHIHQLEVAATNTVEI